jgi:hypothetical protein
VKEGRGKQGQLPGPGLKMLRPDFNLELFEPVQHCRAWKLLDLQG